MLAALLKKDFKLILSNPLHIGIITIVPVLIILILGFTMDNYMTNEYGTLDDARVLYYEADPSSEITAQFTAVADTMSEQIGVVFEKTTDYEEACASVEASEAFAVVTLTPEGFDYFRSEFNEPEGGEIVRSLFVQLTQSGVSSDIMVHNIVLDVEKPAADVYYTFAGLAFALMFMAVLMSNSYGRDFSSGTFTRISMSEAGLPNMILSKLICGMVCGVIQITIAIGVSTLVFGITWKHHFGLILAIFMTLLLFSLCLGVVLGCLIRKESVSMPVVSLCAMLSAYLGGSITPIYLLERLPVLEYLLKISPVYWVNQSLSNLYNGIYDEKTRNCILVLLIMSVAFIAVAVVATSNVKAGTAIAGESKEDEE